MAVLTNSLAMPKPTWHPETPLLWKLRAVAASGNRPQPRIGMLIALAQHSSYGRYSHRQGIGYKLSDSPTTQEEARGISQTIDLLSSFIIDGELETDAPLTFQLPCSG